MHRQKGFTLIELSIVLVIIGLIVGAIVSGRDLIASAQLRSSMMQLEKYQVAVRAFQGKYGDLPGDMKAANAARFGFVTRAGNATHGDGDRILAGGGAYPDGTPFVVPCAENLMFWNDLSTANLISESFNGPDGIPGASTCVAAPAALNTVMPAVKLRSDSYYTVFSYQGVNYYEIFGGAGRQITGAALSQPPLDGLTPREGYLWDTKTDNGIPNTGKVQVDSAIVMGGGGQPTGVPVANCSLAGTPQKYDLTATNADKVGCRIDFAFQ